MMFFFNYRLCFFLLLPLISCATSKDLRLGDKKFSVQLSEYESNHHTAKDNVLFILPPTGGTNLIDKSYARKLSRAGFKVIIINQWTRTNTDPTELEYHNEFYSRAQKALDMSMTHYDASNYYILGTSVGALHGSIAMSRLKQIKAGFLIVGGAPITEVILNSDQKAMQDLKAQRYKKYNFKNDQAYLDSLNNIFRWEPLKRQLSPDQSLGVVISSNDTTVPTKNQQVLIDAWKPKKIMTKGSTHTATVIYTWLFNSGDVVDFFEKELK